MSVQWWRTIHQVQSTPNDMEGSYALGLLLNTIAFTLMAIFCIIHRYHTERVERAVEQHVELAALQVGATREG
jgi:heme exporter protein C